jgi:hypothetical protein
MTSRHGLAAGQADSFYIESGVGLSTYRSKDKAKPKIRSLLKSSRRAYSHLGSSAASYNKGVTAALPAIRII